MRTNGFVMVDGVKVCHRRSRAGLTVLMVGGFEKLNIGIVGEVTEDVVRVAFRAYRSGLFDGDTHRDDRLRGTPWGSENELAEE